MSDSPTPETNHPQLDPKTARRIQLRRNTGQHFFGETMTVTAGDADKLGLKPRDYVLFPMTTAERAARQERERELAAMERREKKAAKAGA